MVAIWIWQKAAQLLIECEIPHITTIHYMEDSPTTLHAAFLVARLRTINLCENLVATRVADVVSNNTMCEMSAWLVAKLLPEGSQVFFM